jgi:hypothetical protein
LSRANGNLAALNSMSFTIDGQKYNVEQLSKLIGFDGPYPAILAGTNILNQPVGGTTGGDVGTFLSLYNEAVASGALSDPLANSTVVSAATQIASLGELTEDVVYNVQFNGMPGDTQNINTLTSDTATALSSSSICTAGDFQDNGVLCSP